MERRFNEQTWAVWLDKMPPGPPRLHVRGTVIAPSTGFKAVAKIDPNPQCPYGAEYVVISVKLVRAGVGLPVLTPVPVVLDETYTGAAEKARIRLPGRATVVRDIKVVH
jgi:hypothetical protein